MSRRALRLYFGALGAAVLLVAAFAFRPTPLTGYDAESLATSVNSGGLFAGDCRRRSDTEWTCYVSESTPSDASPYRVSDPDWWGCWTAEPEGSIRGSTLPDSFSGCITLMDHR